MITLPYGKVALSPEIYQSVPGVTFVIAGQSNASGRGTNNQVYSNPVYKARLYGNDYVWKDLTDPTDSDVGQVDSVSDDSTSPGGSAWPLVATYFMASRHKVINFVPTAMGSTTIANWQPGADHYDRSTLYGSMVWRAIQAGGVDAVIFHLGESDAVAGTSQATFNSALDSFADAVRADLGCPIIAAKIHSSSAWSSGIAAVNAAIAEAWGNNPNVKQGPDLSDLTTDIDVQHFKTDTELEILAGRWWQAIAVALYGASPTTTNIQPDETSSKDTYLQSDQPTTNFGTSTVIAAGENNTATLTWRSLIQPSLSGISASTPITQASLSLFITLDRSSTARRLRIFRMLTSWTEAGATWNTKDGSVAWGSAGAFGAADCEQSDIGSVEISATATGTIVIPISPVALQEIVDGTFTYNGFLLKMDGEVNDGYAFASASDATPGNRPKLTVVTL